VYLPGIALPDNVAVTIALDAALDDTELVVSAIPTTGAARSCVPRLEDQTSSHDS